MQTSEDAYMRQHYTENGDKAFWKWEVFPSLTGDCFSSYDNTQNKQERPGVHLQEESQDQLSQRPVQVFCHLPLEGWLKKKSLYKRHMCSLSGVITGPPRFSFRFQMSSDMFRLAHLCSVSPELLAFYWQILGSLNLCTIDALKSANILFQSNSP